MPELPTNHVIAGAGPVGRSVAAALNQRGITPTVITRSGASVPGATSVAADLSDPTAAKAALVGADVLYQCAQPAYHRWPQEFPGLQRSILDACADHDALFVAMENLYAYGPVSGPLHEGLPLAATTRKGRVRAAMWLELESAHRQGRVRTVAARASDFFGPGVEGSAFGDRFFEPLLTGKGAEVLGDPDRLHSVSHVDDIGEALVRLAGAPETWGRPWHVPNAPTTTVREFVELAAAVAGVEPKLRPMPAWKLRLGGLFIPPARETIEMLYEFTDDFVVDHSAYAAALGDHATPLNESVAATVEAFRSGS
jgi:nucleoside-diphosphate-sugar epimerase